MTLFKRLIDSKAIVLAVFLCTSFASYSQDREEMEKTRATILSLIETLVKSGSITRSQADTMMRDAESRARARITTNPPEEVTPDGKKVVRVPYIPESVKTEMKNQIKTEVMAETRNKNTSDLESSTKFKFVGDVRVRHERNKMSSTNTRTGSNGLVDINSDPLVVGVPTASRGADFFPTSDRSNVFGPSGYVFDPSQNTQRQRLRARLGVIGSLSDDVNVGFGITTGNSSTSPISTNQTLGQGGSSSPGYFNKYPVQMDRAYIRIQPSTIFELNAGRFKNPFVSTDLVWADDMSFDGISSTIKIPSGADSEMFATAGWFPLTTFSPGKTTSRHLTGFQTGGQWNFGLKPNKLKVALGFYTYKGLEGKLEESYFPANSSYLSSEYPEGIRQRGNTLFRTNSTQFNCTSPTSACDLNNTWGLATGFKELNLTTSVDIAQFDPMRVVLTVDMVKNIAYKSSEVRNRTGINLIDLKNFGYLTSIKLGSPVIKQRGEWNLTAAYRYLGSDAVLDAFTSSDYGLGGTNNKGMSINYSFGLATNTWMSLKYISSDLIDSMIPGTSGGANPITKFSVDTLFVDLNARF